MMVVLTAIIYMYQRAFLPAYFFTDEATIVNLMQYVDLRLMDKDSFVNTAAIFSLLGPTGSQVLLLAATSLVIFYVCKRSLRLIDLVFACVLMLSFTLFNLMLVAALYLVYAWQFRAYYALIVAMMIIMHTVFHAEGKWRAALLFLLLLVCLALPGDFWNQLQQARDIVNMDRDGLSDSKTIFSNVLTPNGIMTAFPNAGFAALRFYFAPIFSLRVQEIFLSFTLWLLTFLMFRRRNHKHPLFLLLVANFAIQTFFEPDLGSFFRHLTAYAFCVFGINYIQPAYKVTGRTAVSAATGHFYRST
jgi:hypothetical protein